ncbi:hypothetical protein GLOTRDRAFT_96528 [Gloeophyllum trabeum ATCC 11539]|uniref:Uncharacterized protein n=1 Tax=Gloeophyllum trabeum (strain ATCC 11539 / FP-39264 / Madison 617) TaxID=670483 RepID=S7RAU3_GLOTA|nr:uncharacterized protein GLOTRDRAFT_96528 [Gloeophyllum trabeum ATCC 11539]EPQ51385.1 hypothetical protein GLOTRDRAFT_96528 [Gloeophyllum trabeum ATCC 11539]
MFIPATSTLPSPHNLSVLPTPLTHSVDTCHDIDNCRTLWQVIRSCLVTIFACTWVSLHLNIPAENERWHRGPLRHLGVMLIGIVAPELVVAWAARQWYVSRELQKRWNDRAAAHGKPWSKTHAFFALMGGYVLYSDSHRPEVLDVDYDGDFRVFFASSDRTASLKAEELADKGKKDWLAKTFAIIQTVWFVLQCIARAVQHITVSELELATCGFALLNAVTYFLWWNKPQGVRFPFFVKIQEGPSPREPDGAPHETTARVEHSLGKKTGPPPETGPRTRWRPKLPSGVLYAFSEMAGNDRLHSNNEITGTSVPTFYSGDRTPSRDDVAITLSVEFSIVFGAIHCLAWDFSFPSYLEAALWRSCALVITCMPAVRLLTYFVQQRTVAGKVLGRLGTGVMWVMRVVNHSMVVLYVSARFVLLVLVFTLLRSLPESTFQTVSWTSFIPHV